MPELKVLDQAAFAEATEIKGEIHVLAKAPVHSEYRDLFLALAEDRDAFKIWHIAVLAALIEARLGDGLKYRAPAI